MNTPLRRRSTWFIAVAGALVAVLACRLYLVHRFRSRTPSILLISVDTLRRDHVSAYGYARPTTPHLDRLAAEGALFTDAVSASNWTLPAHMSVLTGLSPAAHGVEDDADRLLPAVLSLGQVMKRSGRATGAFVSHVYLDPVYGYGRGFDDYESAPDQPASDVAWKAIEWLKRRGNRPFFLFLHFFDPHWDLKPPARFRQAFAPRDVDVRDGTFAALFPHLTPAAPLSPEQRRNIVGLYDGEVAFVDHCVGQVIAHLRERRKLDRTVVLVFSDHGEEIGDHGAFGHGTHLHGEVTRVPMLARYPDRISPGTRISGPATLVDIPATLLHLAGMAVPSEFAAEGMPWPASGDAEQGPRRAGRTRVVETTRWGPKRYAVLSRKRKLLTPGTYQPVARRRTDEGQPVETRLDRVHIVEQLYARDVDPLEKSNLLARTSNAAAGDSLRCALRRYIEHHSRGVCLTFEGTDAADTVYRGTVTSDGFADEPFGCPPRPGTRIEPDEGNAFRFVVQPGPDGAGIVLPVYSDVSEVRLGVARNGDALASGPVVLPETDEVRPVGGDRSGCTISGLPAGRPMQAGQLSLTREQQRTLESLGYAK